MLGYGINVGRVGVSAGARAIARRRSSRSSAAASIAIAVLVETLAALARRYDDLLAGRFDAILDAWRRRAPAAVGARVTLDDRGRACSRA